MIFSLFYDKKSPRDFNHEDLGGCLMGFEPMTFRTTI